MEQRMKNDEGQVTYITVPLRVSLHGQLARCFDEAAEEEGRTQECTLKSFVKDGLIRLLREQMDDFEIEFDFENEVEVGNN